MEVGDGFAKCCLAASGLKREYNILWSIISHSLLCSTKPIQYCKVKKKKGFGIVNKAEIDVFLELSCFFDDPTYVNLISGSSAFPKSSLNIWKFMIHVLLKPGLENVEYYFARV